MFQTRITEMFGIRYPIVVGTMMHLAGAEMVRPPPMRGSRRAGFRHERRFSERGSQSQGPDG